MNKHKLLQAKYNLSVSAARELLYNCRNIVAHKINKPEIFLNCFILKYPAAVFRSRLTNTGTIIVDGIPYQVEYSGCTPATILKDNTTIFASFRRLQNDFGLPAVVVIFPTINYELTETLS